jgi:hypothetical protein
MLLASVLMMAFFTVPRMVEMTGELKAVQERQIRQEEISRETDREAAAAAEKARERFIVQQAAIIEQQKRTRELMLANEQLAERLKRKLAGD